MSDDLPVDWDTIKRRFIQLLDEIQQRWALPQHRTTCEAMIRNFRTAIMSRVRSGKLTQQEWRCIESHLNSAVRTLGFSNPKSLELASFVDKRKNRQGTHIPNWNAFYAERAELEHRLHYRDEGQ
jgi:hypothetical protein